jgi:ADP-dependent NAD(P)H-hydrate dehydratase / NAD(P)H-hydrate epimerase
MNGPSAILPPDTAWPLHDSAGSRQIEATAAAQLPPHTLMQRAGLATAKLALAVAPNAETVWIAVGPGNNGGDGLEAALQLKRAGKRVQVSLFGDPARQPADAALSRARAQQAGVSMVSGLPPNELQADLSVDALLGLGLRRAPEGELAAAIDRMNAMASPRLAIDLPSGLDGDTGLGRGNAVVRATHTLALLSLKPGLFTAQGRDHAGVIWFDNLGTATLAAAQAPRAWLGSAAATSPFRQPRRHAQHKGSFGDLIVVGGAGTMAGAALLAGRAAIAVGAGRVYISALDINAPTLDAGWPELMFKPGLWQDRSAVMASTVVCGCGAGDGVREVLPQLLAHAPRLVLDADALNAIAKDTGLQRQLQARALRSGHATVLTPHPLEAARLAGLHDAAAVQGARLSVAEQLAARFGCTVLLKGSGSVIAAPGQVSVINPSGNARLASAGTGDVLAGWLGGLWAASQAHSPPPPCSLVAQAATWTHGMGAEAADDLHAQPALTASGLLARLTLLA